MPKGDVKNTPGRKKTAAINAQWKKWNDTKDAGKAQRKYIAKGTAKAANTVEARPVEGGAQQWTRGKDRSERVSVVGKAIKTALDSKANFKTIQMLEDAQTQELSPELRKEWTKKNVDKRLDARKEALRRRKY